MQLGTIYGLKSGLAEAVVYVGQTRCDPHKRWAEHAKGKTPVSKALRMFGTDDFQFLLLEQVPVDKLNEAERYWIKVYDTVAPKGLNHTEGGSAGRKSPTTVRRMSAAKRQQWADEEYKEKVRKALKEAWQCGDRRSLASERTKAQMAEPGVRAAISAANSGKVRSEATRTRLGALSRERWTDPDFRARQINSKLGKKATAETRAKQSASAKARVLSDELRAAYSAAAKKRWAQHRKDKENGVDTGE